MQVDKKLQLELNKKNLSYYKFLSMIGLSAYGMWSFADIFLVRDNFIIAAITIRLSVVVVFLALHYLLSDKFLIKYHHIVIAANFACLAVATEIIIFNSKVIIPYFSSYFLIPFYTATLLIVPFRYYLIQFLAFLSLHIYYWDDILNLSLEQKIFAGIMSCTVYFLTSLYAIYNYKKMVDNHILDIKIKEQTDKLQKTNTEKISLIRILSHDLANTISISYLSSIRLIKYIDPILPKSDEETRLKIKKTIKSLQYSMTAQQEILKLVRENEKLESGKKEINFRPINVTNVFFFINTLFSTLCEEKNIQFKTIFPADQSLSILSDEKILKNNILQNLLTNAIKFTYNGGHITLSSSIENDHTICFTIQDNGIGMSNKLLGQLFDLNAQTTRNGTGGEEGTGFGMPLVLSSVTALKGKIDISSTSIDDDAKNHGTKVNLKFKKAI